MVFCQQILINYLIMSKRGESEIPMEARMRSAALGAATTLGMRNYYKPELRAQEGEGLYVEPAALGNAANYDMAAANLPDFLDKLEQISSGEQKGTDVEGRMVNKYIIDAMEQEYGKQAYLDVASRLLGLTKSQVRAQDKFITAIGEAVKDERAEKRGASVIADAISSTDPDPNVMPEVAARLGPAINEYAQAVPGANIGVIVDHMNDVVQRMGGKNDSALANVMAGQSQQRAPQVMMGAAAWAAARAGQLSHSATESREGRESSKGSSPPDQGYSGSRGSSLEGDTTGSLRFRAPKLRAATAKDRIKEAHEELCNELSSFVTDALETRGRLSRGGNHEIEGVEIEGVNIKVNITKTADGTLSSPSKYQVQVAGYRVEMSRSKGESGYSDFTSEIVSGGTGATVEGANEAVKAIKEVRPALNYTQLESGGGVNVKALKEAQRMSKERYGPRAGNPEAGNSPEGAYAVATAREHATVQRGDENWSVPLEGGGASQPSRNGTHEWVPRGGFGEPPRQSSTSPGQYQNVTPRQDGWAKIVTERAAATKGGGGRGD